jgi:hypothetical protein
MERMCFIRMLYNVDSGSSSWVSPSFVSVGVDCTGLAPFEGRPKSVVWRDEVLGANFAPPEEEYPLAYECGYEAEPSYV